VLSLVESSSVARALASHSGQRLDLAAEFSGQGLANLAAAFSGGYPVSGSLGRSTLNQRAGSASRLSAAFCGLLTISILLFLGSFVGQTPVASLAGLLLVLANDLVDRDQIKLILHGTRTDRAAFLSTMFGAWLLPLDQAIYLGVGLSIVMFLRRARMLSVREMIIGEKGRFREVEPDAAEAKTGCSAIRILNLTGPLFFAVTGELENALDPFLRDTTVRVLILRLRQAHDIDITTATALAATARRFASTGRVVILLGLRQSTQALVEKSGLADQIGKENLFPAQAGWFTAMEAALRRALEITGPHTCGSQGPLQEYIAAQEELRVTLQTAVAS
jgi:SulP family sulfate permease